MERDLVYFGAGRPEVVIDRVVGLEFDVIVDVVELRRDADESDVSGNALLVLGTGNAGRGFDGGPEGRCSLVEDMVAVAEGDMAVHCVSPNRSPSSILALRSLGEL